MPYLLRTFSASRKLGFAVVMAIFGVASTSADPGEAFPTIDVELGQTVEDFLEENSHPGMTVAASLNGRMVMNKAYGVRNIDTQEPMSIHHRTRIASLSKLLNAATFLKYTEDTANPGLLDEPIFGSHGLLSPNDADPEIYDEFISGTKRRTPVVGTVISKPNDHVYTYYDSGFYSIGTTSDLDARSNSLLPYALPPGKSPSDIVAMAGSTSGGTFTWYRDGSFSCGTFDDLRSPEECYFEEITQLPPKQQMGFLVGVAVAGQSGKVYSWYEDGTRAVGHVFDLAAIDSGQPYQVGVGRRTYSIRSMAISAHDRVYTFYSDNRVSRGTSLDLDPNNAEYDTSLAAGVSGRPWMSWYSQMTPRHLLSHSSGIPRDVSLTGATGLDTGQLAAAGPDGQLGFAKLQKYAPHSRLLFPPGTTSVYSNHAVSLAGYALETVSGETYGDLLETRILDPLGIEMGLAWDPIGDNDATPHTLYGELVETCGCDPIWRFRENSGYLTATAGDYLRFLLAIDNGPGPHGDLLSPASVALMETRAPGSAYGLGWSVSQSGRMMSHSGAVLGGSSVTYRFKAGYSYEGQDLGGIQVVIAANMLHRNSGLGTLALRVAKAVAVANANRHIPSSYDLY
ncbi:MAG: serine hydrolase domain-containing protein [Acidobacteriota bacterium]